MIRRLTEAGEIERLFPLAVADARAVGIDPERIDFEKLGNAFRACLEHAAIFVAEKDGAIVGMMTLCLVEAFWGNEYALSNLIYWVEPEHRKSRAAAELLRAAKEYAQERGLRLDLHVESFADLERKDAFFRWHGFTPCGGNYQFKGA